MMIVVNGQAVELDGEKNLLEVIKKAGIDLPTFCYLSELSVYGSCRMCMVEVDGQGLVAACSTPPRDGMVVRTNTERVHRIRKMVVELLLANHDRDCTTCSRNGSCKLQDLAQKFGIGEIRFGERKIDLPVDESSPSLVRDPNKCILCGDCVRVCSEVQGVGALEFANRGARTTVGPAFGKSLAEVECVHCGQCLAVCPTGAIRVKSEVDAVWDALHDPSKTVIAQIAPAVRVSLGERFDLSPGEATEGKIAAALRRVGFAKVFDTTFAADLTAYEEAAEFMERLERGGPFPQFTSCCPAWVKYCEQYFPTMLANLSTCKSPQQMFGSLAKWFYARDMGISPENLFVVSIMPCTAKKFEARRPEFSRDGIRDVDAVLTTVEAAQILQRDGVDLGSLPCELLDEPLGLGSGGGVIFGATGGVAEAVLRVAGVGLKEAERVRGLAGLKELKVRVGAQDIAIAIISGLARAQEVINAVQNGEAFYHLVEVMACPGGCVGGGGQPHPNDSLARSIRARGLYHRDGQLKVRNPAQNPWIEAAYRSWLGRRGGEIPREYLHTHYGPRKRIVGEDIPVTGAVLAGARAAAAAEGERVYATAEAAAGRGGVRGTPTPLCVEVCVGTNCYLKGSYEVLRRFMEAAEENPEVASLVNLKATFCLERCDKGVSVKVGDRILTGVTPENARAFFGENILARLEARPEQVA